MAGEAVASPMRLATVPGRSARPAPPGNDDPCEERRTIPEGLPRLPREAFARGLRRVAPMSAIVSATAGEGQRQARARARNPTWSAVKASVPVAGLRKTPHRKSGWLARGAAYRTRPRAPCGAQRTQGGHLLGPVRSMRRLPAGHGGPIGVRRRHPSATGAPHAPREGAAKCEERRSGLVEGEINVSSEKR